MKKHIPSIIWIAAGILLAIYVARAYQDVPQDAASQIVLRFSAIYVFIAGMVARTLIHRRENVCVTNFGFKLVGEGLLFLAALSAMLKLLLF